MNTTNPTEIIVKSQITGLILAGGRGSRLGNVDKGLVERKGQSLIKSQLSWITPQVHTVLISANRNLIYYEEFGYKVLTDDSDEFMGPLQGIYQGLKTCKTDWLFVQPVDVPDLPNNTIRRLLKRIHSLKGTEKSGIYFLKSEEREHFLSMLISKTELANLQDYLLKNKRKVRGLLKLYDAVCLDLGINEVYFKNLNQPNDFELS